MVMVAVAAQKAAEDDANELVELNVGRVDGVDDPAHKRQFLLIKSANGKIEKDELISSDADEVVAAAEKALLALTTEKTPLTEMQVKAIKALAKQLGMDEDELEVQPVPVIAAAPPAKFRFKPKGKAQATDETPSKTKGGKMANSTRVRKHDVDEEEEEVLEATDETEEIADDEVDDDTVAESDDDDDEETEEVEEAAGVTARKGSAKAANQRALAASNGPKFKLPTSGKAPVKVPTKAEPGMVTGPKRAKKRADDDLDERIGLAIAAALGPAMERMTETIAAAITPVQKSGKRPVSKQAEGQDDVRKATVPKFGDGLFTSAIFPER